MRKAFEVRRSPIHGNGVFAAKDIAKGDEIIEYRGRVLSHAEANAKYADTVDTGHTFLFTLNDEYVIDANTNGNEARWINHSCDPNVVAFRHDAKDGNPKHERVILEALRDIKRGEELTYDYKITLEQRHTKALKKIWACRCGAPWCSGTLLKDKRGKR
ncbi:SET domain-containing protein-lysine N-methyltransferase [Ahniella affigens]|uniref:SET domain-containing protein-lysine N-methyltransferase n=1 Tax=Ahniella affigens TaxID=2021234 RepID=A0A2P1PSL0_9GAMM|nr:SET domain-containing protein-lysine N-methyltransferase [Ahniella affigens]AVP97828.1 SET domain-containing protein-lysine N-methyltransferase [Ahniella affigens]